MDKKNIWLKGSILLTAVALCVMCVSFFLSVRKSEEAEALEKAQPAPKPEVEIEYVVEQTAMATSSGQQDNRQVIKVVEVVPHQICSAFPYMVDWGTPEEYDKNLPVGYEGLRYLMFKNADGSLGGNYRNRITSDAEPEELTELYNYNVTFKNYYREWIGSVTEEYWRRYEDTDILGVKGYFEYVGEGKGLYDINLEKVVDDRDEESYGIRYELRALNRTAEEAPKGEYDVNSPVCYVAEDYMPRSNPDTELIKQWTDYNYLVAFSCKASGEKNYRIYDVIAKGSSSASLDNEYRAYLADGVQWDYGYEYKAEGNYQVESLEGKTASQWGEDALEGLYLRIESTKKKDGVDLVEPGYFKLYDAVADADSITDETMLYQLTFSASSKGKYVLSRAGVTKLIEEKGGDGTAYSELLFEYLGKGEGDYDVSFIYAPGDDGSDYKGVKYKASLKEVRFEAGRYALASSVENKEDLYIEGTGDYSKLVTSIDCRGIDYDRDTSGRTTDEASPAGVSKGITENTNNEKGSWVFHAVAEEEDNGVTRVEELSKDRIYVYEQNLKKCYYAHNRFCNNEWFKLLIYMSNDAKTEPLAWQDYTNSSLTAKEIKEKYKDKLEEFDRTYRIEIVQRTPSQLTPAEVNEAVLIYFGERVGLENLHNHWNTISSKFGRNLPTFTSAEEDLHYKDDLRADTLMAIYKYCMYDKTTAIMLDMDRLRGNYLISSRYISSNLGKMLVLLDLLGDPLYFAEFIDGYAEKNPEYSTINPNTAEVTAYKNRPDVYNLGKYYWKWSNPDPNEGLEIEPEVSSTWDTYYFRIAEPYEQDGQWQVNTGMPGAHNGWRMDFPLGSQTCYQKNVQDDWTWYAPNYATGVFNNSSQIINIWKIIHNRKSKVQSQPVVVVTNADDSYISDEEGVMPVYYFYVDDYSIAADEDFLVKFKVNWTPEEMATPTGLGSIVVKREDGSNVYSPGSPQYQPTEYSFKPVGDFTLDGMLNTGITQADYRITAMDLNGLSDTVIVRFVVRDGFMLN